MRSLFWPLLFLDDGDAPGGGAAPVSGAPDAAPAAPPAETPKGQGVAAVNRMIAELRSNLAPDGVSILDRSAPAPEPVVAVAADEPVAEAPAAADTPKPTDAPAAAPVADAPAADLAQEAVAIKLPGRRQGEDDLEVFIDDPAIAERVRGMQNDVMRTEEVRRQLASVDKQRDELTYIEDQIKLDPVGFMTTTIPAELRREVALAILAEEGVLEALKPALDVWLENPDKREIDRLQAEKRRTTQVSQAQQNHQQRAQVREATRFVTGAADAIAAIVPADRQARFTDDFLRDVQDHAGRGRLNGPLNHERLIDTLKDRLSLYGITPEQALAAVKSPGSTGLPVARPSGADAERIAALVTNARTTGDQLRKASITRRAAAVVPSPGAGGSPPVQEMPKENVQSRIARMRGMLR